MCQFTRFVVGAAIGSVVWMTSMWASAAEENAPKKAKVPHCTFSELQGKVIISCPKPTLICEWRPLSNGKPGEKVLVCEGGLPTSN